MTEQDRSTAWRVMSLQCKTVWSHQAQKGIRQLPPPSIPFRPHLHVLDLQTVEPYVAKNK